MKQLSEPAPRKALHTRQITCAGYEREDGLWEVEGRISDVRTWAQDGAFGSTPRPAGEPLHLMSLRLTLDDDFTIVAAEAVTHAAPYPDCQDINASYGQLVGLRIEAGFTQAVKKLLRGTQGCTHLTDLLGPVATTALQTINPIKFRRRLARGEPLPDEGPNPPLLNSCHGWRQGGQPAVVRWGRRAE
jgi:hypothetical protein